MLFTDIIFVSCAIFGSVVAAITDLRKRLIPDSLNYFLILFGFGGHLVLSVLQNSILPIAYSLAGAGFFYIISLLMFYGGVWGGGDAKLMVGLGALLPIRPQIVFVQYAAPWPFILTLWINALLFGALFGLVSVFWLGFKNQTIAKKEIKKQFAQAKWMIPVIVAVAVFLIVAYFFNMPPIILGLVGLCGALLPLLVVTKAVEESCMTKYISPLELVEGDWVVEEIKLKGKTIYSPKKYGIEKKDIDKLIKLKKKGKLNKVKIKEGVPYAPAILTALLVSIFIGDSLLFILGGAL